MSKAAAPVAISSIFIKKVVPFCKTNSCPTKALATRTQFPFLGNRLLLTHEGRSIRSGPEIPGITRPEFPERQQDYDNPSSVPPEVPQLPRFPEIEPSPPEVQPPEPEVPTPKPDVPKPDVPTRPPPDAPLPPPDPDIFTAATACPGICGLCSLGSSDFDDS